MGQTTSYFKTFLPGVGIGHALCAYNYPELLLFECLSAKKSNCPDVSDDVLDREKAQSIFFWFKQMGDRQEFEYEYFDDVTKPLTYFLQNPQTNEVNKPEAFEDWPLEIKSFAAKFATVPKNPFFL